MAIFRALQESYKNDAAVWELANDVPDLSELNDVASKLGVRLEDVLQ